MKKVIVISTSLRPGSNSHAMAELKKTANVDMYMHISNRTSTHSS